MVKNENVFVNAKMLAERLGYTFGENGECAVIFNNDTTNGLPFGITQFKYNSTQVSHMLFNNVIDTYEAPFASIKNSEGSWIPLEYSLLVINSGMMITDDALLIDIPTKRIINHFFDIAKNTTRYGFDWADDFGYTETDIKILSGSSHLINVFHGVLGFDGASWASLFQQFSGSMASYDKKYGENLAMLLCTELDKELQASMDKVAMLIDLLDEEGELGQMLSSTSASLDLQVGTLYKNCEDILQKVKSGNSSLISYNRSYQALEDALDRQTWFSGTGGNILEMHEVLGIQAASVLFAWNIASNTIPFLTNGLSGADSFELALYSMAFQGDTFLNYLSKRDAVFADTGNITAENMYELSQYCYIYLKSCYVTRESALASLVNKSDSTREKIQPLIDYQNSINTEIAKIMVELKEANETNDGCVFGFLPIDNEDYLSRYDDGQLLQWIDAFKNRTLSESELLAIMESAAGHKMENHVYIDMDHDGTSELIGVYGDEMGLYQTWYCSGDGKTCVLVHQNNDGMDACEIELLDLGNETHVVLNAYRMLGTGKNYSIIALRNQNIVCLISNQYGYVFMTDDGEIMLNVETYDGMYDPCCDGMIVHTWKNTYLFFDGNEYQEYGATELTENEFMEYQNSQELKDKIEGELRQPNTIFLEFKYFKRSNGIMHIQCNVYSDSGEIEYGYYTVTYIENEVSKDLGEYNAGQMESSFSTLEIVY